MSLQETHKMATEAHKLASKAHEVAQIGLVKQDAHEKVCADRYQQILNAHEDTQVDIKEGNKRIQQFQNWATAGTIVIIGILLAYIWSVKVP